jgi:hypothetical protein
VCDCAETVEIRHELTIPEAQFDRFVCGLAPFATDDSDSSGTSHHQPAQCVHLKVKAWGALYGKGLRCVHCGVELTGTHNDAAQQQGIGTGVALARTTSRDCCRWSWWCFNSVARSGRRCTRESRGLAPHGRKRPHRFGNEAHSLGDGDGDRHCAGRWSAKSGDGAASIGKGATGSSTRGSVRLSALSLSLSIHLSL